MSNFYNFLDGRKRYFSDLVSHTKEFIDADTRGDSDSLNEACSTLENIMKEDCNFENHL